MASPPDPRPEIGRVNAVDEDASHFQARDPVASMWARPSRAPSKFGRDVENGQGMKTIAHVDKLSWGAKLGAASRSSCAGASVRLKPSIGCITSSST
jgi:hypothetical protein